MTEPQLKYPNALIHESSPYLLQHAYNPVQWYAWKPEVLQMAKEENKLLLISIGYSSCHWCHVMEHECFEDEETALLMNRHFINIKVDREEHPDVDQVYMNAVQLITGRGGWPLNCIALPDGKPIYGGTYFPKQQWKSVLLQVSDFYKRDFNKCREYALDITSAVHKSVLANVISRTDALTPKSADRLADNWKSLFDLEEGGPMRAPKFPLPNNFEFLLRYAYHTGKNDFFDYVYLTLDKMAMGGIYDQLGGGFARYAVDRTWKVPHFEKMLYDNAQLISLYSKAWQQSKKPLYKKIVIETIAFLEREMKSIHGGFFSALDADSEGVEGKYYVWTIPEIESNLGRDAALFKDYFCINKDGYWENENYILLRKKSDEEIFQAHGISMEAGLSLIQRAVKILFEERKKRTHPGLDDKILLSWNALVVNAYVDAFHAFQNLEYLHSAQALCGFLLEKFKKPDGKLFRTCKESTASINGFLEDYAFLAEALINLYSTTADENYLIEAKNLVAKAFESFFDKNTGYFFFTSSEDAPLFARSMDIEDNVMPSSNSSMAKVIFKLSYFFTDSNYFQIALGMLKGTLNKAIEYGSSYSNWAILLLDAVFPFYEVVITGPQAISMSQEVLGRYIPNIILAPSSYDSPVSIFSNRFIEGKSLIFICENKTCHAPLEEITAAIKLLQERIVER